jgi:hypothetical protein
MSVAFSPGWRVLALDFCALRDATVSPPGGHHGGRQGAEPRLDRGAATGRSQPDRPVFAGPGTPADTAPPQARGGQAPKPHDPRGFGASNSFARAEGMAGVPVLGVAGTPAASHRLALGEGRTPRPDVTAWTAEADKAPVGTGKGPAGAGDMP